MEYQHILVATDFSELGNVAVSRGVALARRQRAKLTLAHVLPARPGPSPLLAHYFDSKEGAEQIAESTKTARADLEALLLAEGGDLGLQTEVLVCCGDPADEILSLAARISPDLILVATHGRRGISEWIMGSVAKRVLTLAKTDVLAVRNPPSDAAERAESD